MNILINLQKDATFQIKCGNIITKINEQYYYNNALDTMTGESINRNFCYYYYYFSEKLDVLLALSKLISGGILQKDVFKYFKWYELLLFSEIKTLSNIPIKRLRVYDHTANKKTKKETIHHQSIFPSFNTVFKIKKNYMKDIIYLT